MGKTGLLQLLHPLGRLAAFPLQPRGISHAGQFTIPRRQAAGVGFSLRSRTACRCHALFLLLFLLAGCSSSNPGTGTQPTASPTISAPATATLPTASPTISAPATATPEALATPTPEATALAVPASRRIGIRTTGELPEFYDKETGERFTPIGPNFHNLGPEKDYFVDRLFSPRFFDAAQIDKELQAVRAYGYTVIRTSLDVCVDDCIGAPGGGLREDYLDNIATLLQLAQDNDLLVILTSNDLPLRAGYVPKVEATCCGTFDGYMNSHYLSPTGVAQWTQYWQDVIHALIARHAPLDAILAYQIRGELFLFEDKPPLSLTSGLVTTANGKTYDMADAAQKQAMIEEGLVYWADTVSAGIRELDPTAMTTIGLFPPNEPYTWLPESNRYVPPVTIFAETGVDFLDLHPYPGYLPLAQLMENFEVSEFSAKPWIMGEFGGFKFVYATPAAAALGLQDWQVESCKFGAQGWFFWHWMGTDDHEVWTGSEGGEAIRKVLAPVNRPDPCSARSFDFFEPNLALGQSVTASRSLPEGSPELAVDGWRSTLWQSGADAPQWIEIDLGQPSTIQRLRLFTSQYPEGETTHQIWVGGPDHNLQLADELTGFTQGDQELSYNFPEPLPGIQYIRIKTTRSPSWVSWKEIAVFGTLP